jgi:flagellar export protein FliJ
MSPRQRRIQRILDHRQKELDERAGVLAAVRAKETAAVREADAADARAREAADARRKLALTGADVLSFLEAEEWLVSTARRAERAWALVVGVRREVEKAQAVVVQARTKLKQAEQLAARVALGERRLADRRERRRDDETAARIAQRKAAVAGNQ